MSLRNAVPAVSGLTHVGCVRRANEDSIFLASDNGCVLAVVADGMGGHAGGAVASQLAVAEYERAWHEGKDGIGGIDAGWLVRQAQAANRKIRLEAANNPALKQMGTTLVALLVMDDVAHIAHIGDSRCYRLSAEHFVQLTRDHSVVQQMVDEGALTEEEAERSPIRNYLTRSLGSQNEAGIELQSLSLRPGDRLLLCTDGLSNMLSSAEISRLLSEGDSSVVCEEMLALALSRGATDNVSVIACTL